MRERGEGRRGGEGEKQRGAWWLVGDGRPVAAPVVGEVEEEEDEWGEVMLGEGLQLPQMDVCGGGEEAEL